MGIAAFLEEVEVKKRPYCRFFCKNLTARENIKSHPKIGANSRRNKLYHQYGSASKFKRSEIVSIHEEEEEEKLVQMTAKAVLAEMSFHGKRYNEAMNHLKEVEVLNDEFLKGSKSENKDY